MHLASIDLAPGFQTTVLAIFFWIMPWRVWAGRVRSSSKRTCYFLLNYAEKADAIVAVQVSNSGLLFSFELCGRRMETGTEARLEQNRLAIFFWIMPADRAAAMVLYGVQVLLFSFELCTFKADEDLVYLLDEYASLAIFFWIMRRRQRPSTSHLAIFFWIMLSNTSHNISRNLSWWLAIFFWIMRIVCEHVSNVHAWQIYHF